MVCHCSSKIIVSACFLQLIAALGNVFRHTYLQLGMLNYYFRKNAELEEATEKHSKAVLQLREEHSNTLCKLGKTVAEFERYLIFIKV